MLIFVIPSLSLRPAGQLPLSMSFIPSNLRLLLYFLWSMVGNIPHSSKYHFSLIISYLLFFPDVVIAYVVAAAGLRAPAHRFVDR